ncbi:DUF397 domain-containing protein [Actinoallomurus acaciae]|uniref:DUF397 domain-containing protein n=1 Tax=Actinoallomurus acaciae TaxID=502577 RepID=A0ABV5YPZ4_9ACTN
MSPLHNGMPAGGLADAQWHKSPASSPQGNCVELATLPGEQIAMRNSRHPDGPVLIFAKAQLKDLIDAVKHGAFDHLLIRPHGDGTPRPPDPRDG